jgi:KUP system potassium uptake protein
MHTSAKEMGQIYLPLVNWLLLTAVILVVLGFGNSSALASAYGIAVTVTMLATTILTFFVVHHAWSFPLPVAAGATALFLVVDAILVAACSLKFLQGGWFPLVLGFALFTIMASWRRGRELLVGSISQGDPELVPFLQVLALDEMPRARRTAVYAVASQNTVPQALLHNL